MRPDLQEVFAPRQQQTEVQQQKSVVSEVEEKTEMSQSRQDDACQHNEDDHCQLDKDDSCELERGKQQLSNSDRHPQPVVGKFPHKGSPKEHSGENQHNGIKVHTRANILTRTTNTRTRVSYLHAYTHA